MQNGIAVSAGTEGTRGSIHSGGILQGSPFKIKQEILAQWCVTFTSRKHHEVVQITSITEFTEAADAQQ